MERLYKNQIQTSSAERGEKMKFEIKEVVCPACKGQRVPCQTCNGCGIIYRWLKN